MIRRFIRMGIGRGGGGASAPYTPPLDGYDTPFAAYSTRQLLTSYSGPVVKLRRDSDNAEEDFGFSAGWLDTAAITTWLGAATGYVATWYDQSGGGNHATQATTTRQPKFILSTPAFDNRATMLFDSDGLATANINLSATPAASIICRSTLSTPNVTRMMVEFSNDINSANGGFAIWSTNTGVVSVNARGNLNFSTYNTGSKVSEIGPYTIAAVMDMALAANESIGYIDGVAGGAIAANANNTGNFGTYPLNIGSRAAGASLYWLGNMAELLLFPVALSDVDRAAIAANVLAAFTDRTFTLDDNMRLTKVAADSYVWKHQPSPYSRAKWNTTASSVDVLVNFDGSGAPHNTIGVTVNGTRSLATIPAGAGTKTVTVALGAGVSTVELLGGGSGGFSGPAVQILGATFNTSATRATLPTTPRICVYGDSIASGTYSSALWDAWPVVVRGYYSGSVITEAWPGRTLKNSADTEANRILFADRFGAVSPTIIWLAIGTNDYGVANTWSAADFGTAYADLLDRMHTELPDAVLYTQTPIVRATETANGYGDTLDDYRTQIATAAGARPVYCVLVDGTDAAFPQLADLGDGLHPTSAGYLKYAQAVMTILGITY